MELFFLFTFGTVVLLCFAIGPHLRNQQQTQLLQTKADLLRYPPFDAGTSSAAQTNQIVVGNAYVIDGDSLVISKTQVRLFGIDAPELNHPYGQKAKWALVALCKRQKVRADVTEVDVYGRTVAKCFLEDGRDLSEEMVKLGLAIDWPKFSGGVYRRHETPDARKKLWLADARQKGRMHVWEKFEANQVSRPQS